MLVGFADDRFKSQRATAFPLNLGAGSGHEQEKQRIAETLGRLDTERTKLADQLSELEIAERVLTRFGAAAESQKGRRPERTALGPTRQRRGRAIQQARSVSLSTATLQAVQAHPEGATATEIITYLSRQFGSTVRPNHLAIALQRHRRADRLENRDQRWYIADLALEGSVLTGSYNCDPNTRPLPPSASGLAGDHTTRPPRRGRG
jgi:hypothetical protein